MLQLKKADSEVEFKQIGRNGHHQHWEVDYVANCLEKCLGPSASTKVLIS